jgi:hypothetical protein
LLAVAGALLAGCGRSDSYSVMPEVLKQPRSEPKPPDPQPKTVRLFRDNIDLVFMESARPQNVMISKPRRNSSGYGWNVCVKASVSSINHTPIGVQTYLVEIENGAIGFRRPAEPKDGCQAESYERI